MEQSEPQVYRAAVCIPELVADPEVALSVEHHFGRHATWVVTVSRQTFESLKRWGAAVLQVGACRPPGCQAVSAVLALQVTERQVRCVASLDDARVLAALRQAKAEGVFRLAIGPYGGGSLMSFHVPFEARGLDDVLALVSGGDDAKAQRASIIETARLCTNLREVPTFIRGVSVAAADVSVVLPDCDPFAVEGAVLAAALSQPLH